MLPTTKVWTCGTTTDKVAESYNKSGIFNVFDKNYELVSDFYEVGLKYWSVEEELHCEFTVKKLGFRKVAILDWLLTESCLIEKTFSTKSLEENFNSSKQLLVLNCF